MTGPVASLPPLRGMLLKKHKHVKPISFPVNMNWGKRYFEVDDERGILYYFRTRSAQEWEEPAHHFLLSTLLCAAVPEPARAWQEYTMTHPPVLHLRAQLGARS